jgi:prepilin signal peptidase PulO-like enzyme (type II secretory pathway)
MLNFSEPESILYFTGLVYAFVIGSVIGSFFTASASRVIYFFYSKARKNKKQRWKRFLTERSRCSVCHTQIPPQNLIPILSYFFLKGRCAKCGAPIGWYTLAGELFLALLFPFLLLMKVHYAEALIYVIITGHLYISIATDYRYYQLDWENSFWMVFWLILFSVHHTYYYGLSSVEANMISSGVVTLIFGLLWLIRNGKYLGTGDLILAPIPAFLIPFPYTFVYLISSSFFSIVWAYSGKRKGNIPIPFGVFLSFGFFFSMVFMFVSEWLN